MCRRKGEYLSLGLFYFVNLTSSCSLIPWMPSYLLTHPAPLQKQTKTTIPKQNIRGVGGGGIQVVAVYDFSSTPYCPFQKTTTLHHNNSFSVYCPFQKEKEKNLAP